MKKKGFTLIELLIVVGIVTVLVGVTIAVVNPLRQFAKANNARRWADITNTINSISQKMIDDKGVWATSTDCAALPATTTQIKKSGGYDLCGCVVPKYVGNMPVDPTAGTPAAGVSDCVASYDAGYTLYYSSTTRRVTVSAPNAQIENGSAPTISVIR